MSGELRVPAGYRLFSFDTLDSTNAEALRRIAAGAQAGDIFWARIQSGGRGRRGRKWHSPPGNLYATLVVDVPSIRSIGQLAFVTAIGAGDALKRSLASPELLQYKWPNDLMLEGRKLGGILIEVSPVSDTQLVAVGMGLNLISNPLGMNAASLLEAGVEVDVADMLAAVCKGFDHWYRIWRKDGFSSIREYWLKTAHGMNERIKVQFPDGAMKDGLFRGIDESGALILEDSDGSTTPIATGEVFLATS